MTNKDFLEALSEICSDPEYDNKFNNKKKKMKNTAKAVIVCAAALAAVIGAVLLFKSVSAKRPNANPPYNNGTILIKTNSEEVTPFDEPASTDAPGLEQTPKTVLAETKWFDDTAFQVRQLTYANMDANISTLNSDNLGVRHISAEVKGDHADCQGCYYNAETGEVVCLYHEFLAVSGVKIDKGYGLRFYPDRVRDDLVAVRLYDEGSVLTEGLWIYDRKTGNVAEIGLPEGCGSYEELYVYENCLWNGKLAVGVNPVEGVHCTYVLNTDIGKAAVVPGTENSEWSSASFIGDNILLLTADGYSFLNIDTGTHAQVVGEYNYFTDGKVFSIKNWGWANHSDVEVAVYDAATGAIVDDQPVLVKTVLDGGARVFLVKNSTSGEETVILDNYDQNAYTWSKDNAYFYAFSEANRKLVCYSASDGQWIANTVLGVSTEPVTIDGKECTVDCSYALAVSDRNSDVTLYYTRTIEERLALPDYEDEKVDSPYWDKYREIKAANFDGKDRFSMWFGGNPVGIIVKDMTWLRDEILTICDGNRIDKLPDQTDTDHLKVEIHCGSVDIWFIEYEDACYAYLGYNMLNPVGGHGHAEEMYEIPHTLLEAVESYYNETYNSGRWY